MPAKMISTTASEIRAARPAQPRDWLSRVQDMLTVRRTRKDLAQLYEHQLRDIGVSGDAAAEEASRPFWDLSDHWQSRR